MKCYENVCYVCEQVEIESKKVLMETLQGKVTQLQAAKNDKQPDIELQVKNTSRFYNTCGTLKQERFQYML